MRYFIACYAFREENGNSGNGFRQFQQDNYPSFKAIESLANKGMIVITNIIELNKDDYESFNSIQTNK